MNNSPLNPPVSSEEEEQLLSNVDSGDNDTVTSEAAIMRTEGRKGDIVAKYAVLTAVLIFVLTSWGIVFSNDPVALGWFSFHPIFQSTAIASFTYGILTLQPTSLPGSKAAGLQRHQIAMIGIGIPCILLGAGAMIYNKSSHSAPHFTSWHGTCGIITVVWLIIQATFGAASVWYGGAALGGGMKAKSLWKYHRLSGYILLPLALFTAHLAGSESYWVTHNSSALARFVAYNLAPVVIVVGIYSRIRPSKMKF